MYNINISLKNKIITEIDKHKIVSFGMFDTLVYRPFMHPHQLFDYLGKKYERFSFPWRRKVSEILLCKFSSKKQYSLDDIYKTKLMNGLQSFKMIEEKYEISLTYQNQEMYELYKYALD